MPQPEPFSDALPHRGWRPAGLADRFRFQQGFGGHPEMRARGFIVPKACEQAADCQDRFSINPVTGSVAVCDGMSQSFFPKYWAEILAEQYTREKGWFPTPERVAELGPSWKQRVESRLDRFRVAGIDPWRSEMMLREGCSAGSTLVGVRILAADGRALPAVQRSVLVDVVVVVEVVERRLARGMPLLVDAALDDSGDLERLAVAPDALAVVGRHVVVLRDLREALGEHEAPALLVRKRISPLERESLAIARCIQLFAIVVVGMVPVPRTRIIDCDPG